MKTNKYGETLYPDDKGNLVPWYIKNLLTYGNSVIPTRKGLDEESIFRDYGIKVSFRLVSMVTSSDAIKTEKETCIIGERIE